MDVNLYKRTNKSQRVNIIKKEGGAVKHRPLSTSIMSFIEVDRSTECHITPQDTARRMANYLDCKYGHNLLEPQCGTGSLLSAVLDVYGNCFMKITLVERHCSLYNVVSERFNEINLQIINSCFIEKAKSLDKYDRIISNPPFSQTKKHIDKAFSLLKDGGKMVALVPVTFQHKDAILLESLPSSTFQHINVNTKIIMIEARND